MPSIHSNEPKIYYWTKSKGSSLKNIELLQTILLKVGNFWNSISLNSILYRFKRVEIWAILITWYDIDKIYFDRKNILLDFQFFQKLSEIKNFFNIEKKRIGVHNKGQFFRTLKTDLFSIKFNFNSFAERSYFIIEMHLPLWNNCKD